MKLKYIFIKLLLILLLNDCYILSKKLIKLIPILEYAQNDTHIYIHIINKQSLPLNNITISLTKTSLKIYYELFNNKESIYYEFDRIINLYSIVKNETLFIKEENEMNLVIYFEKIIPSFYWNYLDQESDDHDKIFIWLYLYNKYQDKSKINKYKDFVEDNLIIKEYNDILKERENNLFYSTDKRNYKLKKVKEDFIMKNNKKKYFQYKNKIYSFPKIKKCFSNNHQDIFDINFWIY